MTEKSEQELVLGGAGGSRYLNLLLGLLFVGAYTAVRLQLFQKYDHLLAIDVLMICLPFVGVGLTILLQQRITIRPRDNLVLVKRFLFSRPQQIKFSDLKGIVIERRKPKTRNNGHQMFGVDFQLEKRKPIRDFPKYHEARAFAEKIAKFSGKDLHDYSEGNLRSVSAECLDESVRQTIKREGVRIKVPKNPNHQDIIINPIHGERSIFFDRSLLTPKYFMAAGFALMFISTVQFLGLAHLSQVAIAVFLFVAILAFGHFRRDQILLSTQDFTLRSAIGPLAIRRKIKLTELEELFVGRVPIGAVPVRTFVQLFEKYKKSNKLEKKIDIANDVVARSNKKSLRFGIGLTQEECEFVVAQLKVWIGSQPDPQFLSPTSEDKARYA